MFTPASTTSAPATRLSLSPTIAHRLSENRPVVRRPHGRRPQGLDIIHTIISLAQTLGAKVIAEGAETAEQVALLKAWKCQYAQGYYFSPPVPPDAAEKLLAGS